MQMHTKLFASLLFASLAGVGFAEDAYVQTSSSAFVNTGYKPNGRAKVELDFELVGSATEQQRLIGTDADGSSGYKMTIYNSGGYFAFAASDDWRGDGSGIRCDNVRHIAIVDAPNRKAYLLTGSETNKEVVLNSPVGMRTSPHPLVLGGRTTNANGTSIDCVSPMKVYGFRVWEDGQLVRDMRPCLFNGVAYLKDEVTGVFAKSDNGGSGVLGYGGDIAETEDSAYVESDGTWAVNSRFTMRPGGRVELDYAMVGEAKDQDRVMGSLDGQVCCEVYISKSGGPSFTAGNYAARKGYNSGKPNDNARHTVVFDAVSSTFSYLNGFSTVYSQTFPTITQTATSPITIAARSLGHSVQARQFCSIWRQRTLKLML